MDESSDRDVWLLSHEKGKKSKPSHWRTYLTERLQWDAAAVALMGLSVVVFLVSRLEDLDEKIRANESWKSFLRTQEGGTSDSEYYGTKAELEYQYEQVWKIARQQESFAKGDLGEWQKDFDLWLAERKKAVASPSVKEE